jgi:HAD superfamily hydrolase (TIGR01509 family)
MAVIAPKSAATTSVNTILFDWDGTLFDSAVPGFTAFQKAFAELGVAFDHQRYEAAYSPNWYAMYEALGLPPEQWRRADELWLQHYGEQPPQMVGGGRETLLALHQRGYCLGVVSSGTHVRVAREIRQLGLDSLFGVLVCNEHVVRKKPDPEGLIMAMRQLNSSPERCCYVGDAPEDIQMGRSARLLTVGVPSSYPSARRLPDCSPDLQIASISDLLLYFDP